MKVGIVLEGGAMRGMYTAGVLDVLMENNIFVLRPSKDLNFKRTEKNPDRLKEMYELGKNDALHKLNEIKEFVACKKRMN